VTVFDQTLPARVTAEAHDIQFGRLLAVILAGILYAIGWTAARAVRGVWFVLTWSFTAVRLGWREGFAPPGARSQ
jgi:hypothetical protein